MTLQQLSKWENLVRYHPTPWYLEQCNDKGVEVRDSRGETVFYDDFGSIPDELASSFGEHIRGASTALALFLVAFSEKPN